MMVPELTTLAAFPETNIADVPTPFADMVPVPPFVTSVGPPVKIVPRMAPVDEISPVFDVTVTPPTPALSAPPVPPDIVPALATVMVVPALMAVPEAPVAVICAPLVGVGHVYRTAGSDTGGVAGDAT